jgi:pyruvate,orthophosphate dikinase
MSLNEIFFIAGGKDRPARQGTVEEMGFKAYNLGRMAAIGLNVPSAFVLGTAYCSRYAAGKDLADRELRTLLQAQIDLLQTATGRVFGDARNPLLVSVRSGAPVSMPGMLETVLNVGLNEQTLHGLLRQTGNPRLAWDSYRRLVQMFAEVVHGVDVGVDALAAVLDETLKVEGIDSARELDFLAMRKMTHRLLDLFRESTGDDFPQDPLTQLEQAVLAVFRSWNSSKAAEYRKLNHLESVVGTAVTVQQMVFGNSGSSSGSGVGFTRDPATGEKEPYLDFLVNAQGEDVVGGRSPMDAGDDLVARFPETWASMSTLQNILEREFADAQDFEFTVENNTLYLLQTRAAKRTPLAAARIAVEMAEEGIIDVAEAARRLAALDLDSIGNDELTPGAADAPLASAIGASAGAVSGRIALGVEQAKIYAAAGDAVVLVRDDIVTDDVAGIFAAAGILTHSGGRTSHAAVIARQMNKVCLVGCAALSVDGPGRTCTIGTQKFYEGDVVTLDANHGLIYAGAIPSRMIRPERLLDKARTLLAQARR